MKPYVIWGSAGHAKVVNEIISAQGGQVIALFDNLAVTPALAGVELFVGKDGFKQWLNQQSAPAQVHAVLAIGGARGQDRHALQVMLQAAGLSIASLQHPRASLSASAKLAAGCQLLANSLVAAEVEMGEACIINHNANVDHECQLGHGVHIAPNATLCGCISLGDYSFVGAGAVILPRLKIGRGAVVGAGAVVTRDVPDFATVVGNPARLIRQTEV